MILAWKKLRAYFRIGLIVIVALAVVLLLFKNRGNEVAFWFFGITDAGEPINVLWLMLLTSITTLVAWWTVFIGFQLLKDFRELKRLQREGSVRKKEIDLDKREKDIERVTRQAQDASKKTDDEAAGEA
ncbi:MAG: hypothetical protein ACYTHJ_16070 [Planctomycetota bacterium]|jgi:hypothetical protein